MSYYKDLHDHIKALEDNGKLIRVSREINKDTELQPLVRLQYRGLKEKDRMAFLFENVTDVKGRKYDIPVITGGLSASADIYAMGLQCEVSEIASKWEKAYANPIEPITVETGPVHDIVIMGDDLYEDGNGLEKIPIPISTPGFDNGPYTSASHWVTKDPETGIYNLGNYRGQLKGKTKLGAFVAPAQDIGVHWKKCKNMGKPLEAAIVVGCAPNISYAAVTKMPIDVSEYAIAGGLAGAPVELVKCKTVDLEVPAYAEIVIEGRINTEYLEPEGPFAEHSGYLSPRLLHPYFEVTCITHRKDAIYVNFISQMPPSESSKLRGMGTEKTVYNFLKNQCGLDGIIDVAFTESCAGWYHCVIQMKKKHEGEPWQALNAAVSHHLYFPKIVIAVDEDVDPRNPESVNWALCLNMQPERDVRIVPGKGCSMGDYSAIPPDEQSLAARTFPQPNGASALLINATRRWGYPPLALPKKEYMEKAMEIWQELDLPELELAAPWYGVKLGWWPEEIAEECELALQGRHYETGDKLATRKIRV